MSERREANLYGLGVSRLMEVGGEAVGEWRPPWVSRLLRAAWLDSEGSTSREN